MRYAFVLDLFFFWEFEVNSQQVKKHVVQRTSQQICVVVTLNSDMADCL